ncbi:MAG: hypothetical protein IPH13_20320 [Planctomycetes bacterium]|nr:hypothetical protein [Planctomycetota bacterium]
MAFYWVEIKGSARGGGTAQADSADAAKAIAVQAGHDESAIGRVRTLPYPANPYLNEIGWPDFCYQPETCAGKHSCQARRACTE